MTLHVLYTILWYITLPPNVITDNVIILLCDRIDKAVKLKEKHCFQSVYLCHIKHHTLQCVYSSIAITCSVYAVDKVTYSPMIHLRTCSHPDFHRLRPIPRSKTWGSCHRQSPKWRSRLSRRRKGIRRSSGRNFSKAASRQSRCPSTVDRRSTRRRCWSPSYFRSRNSGNIILIWN